MGAVKACKKWGKKVGPICRECGCCTNQCIHMKKQ
jgi:hypothetical protein